MGAVAAGEAVHWATSYALIPRRARTAGPHPAARVAAERAGGEPPGTWAILVLGYRNRHPSSINSTNRRRVRAAARTLAAAPPGSRLIFSGGSRGSGRSEASLMAEQAREAHDIPAGAIVVEEDSLTTWQNVDHTLPLLESAQGIAVVSDSMHAVRGRWYLRRQRPDLAARLVRGADYRFGEACWLKPALAVHGCYDLARTYVAFLGRAPGQPSWLDAYAAARRPGAGPRRRQSGMTPAARVAPSSQQASSAAWSWVPLTITSSI